MPKKTCGTSGLISIACTVNIGVLKRTSILKSPIVFEYSREPSKYVASKIPRKKISIRARAKKMKSDSASF